MITPRYCMNNQVAKALSSQFDRHCVIFWYDAKKELRNEFNALDLPNSARH